MAKKSAAKPQVGSADASGTEEVSKWEYIEHAIEWLNRAEAGREDAQRRAVDAVAAGRLEELRTNPSAVLGESDARSWNSFCALAKPLLSVAYALNVDAGDLDALLRTGHPKHVAGAVRAMRQTQGELLRRESTNNAQAPLSEDDALRQLETRESWGVDELPANIGVDLLRCLDERELIEARFVTMCNKQRFPGDAIAYAPSPSEWFSPMRKPSMAGDWKAIVSKLARDSMHHPNEVRVSERGRAAVARLRRDTGPGPKVTPTRRKKRTPTLTVQARPMTPKELQAMEVVGRHKQNFAAAAAELNKDPKTVRENYLRAMKKLARIDGTKSRSVSAGSLPTDKRGNQDPRDRRGG